MQCREHAYRRGAGVFYPGYLSAIILMVMMLVCISGVKAQYYIRGQDPSTLRWQQIETDHFRLIFPEDYQERAIYAANLLEYIYHPGSRTLGHPPRKLPVIIHNHTVVPNGFVSWAPARMELFSNPPPHNDQHSWLERLAVHEFRHVVQVDMLNQGVTGVMSSLLGEHITGLSLGLFMPLWLLEGDAVVAETGLTHGGRGRQPAFEQGLRAQLLEREGFSYDKAILGSFKDHVPNHYELGYQLAASGRASFGYDLWDNVITNIARRPYTVFPLSFGLKKHTGLNLRQFYNKTIEELEAAWKDQMASHDYTGRRVINKDKEVFTDYRPMAFLSDTTLLVLKTGMGDIPRLISLSVGGEEQHLLTPGFYNPGIFSLGNGLIAWSEIRRDPRWEHRTWSEIYVHPLDQKKTRRLTTKTRFFSPAVSPDGKTIAATEVSSADEYALLLLDAASGEEQLRLSSPANAYLMSPQWHPQGDHLVVIALDEEGKRILSVDLSSGSFKSIFHAGHTDISRPRYLNDHLLAFNGAFSGIDNVYVLDKLTGEVDQRISARFGAIDAVINQSGGLLAWSDYSSMGYHAVVYEGQWPVTTPLSLVEDYSVAFHRVIAEQENALVSQSHIPLTDHEVQDYRKGRHLFNVHSWAPLGLNIDHMEVTPGVSVFSQNDLSTSVASLGYRRDMNEQLGAFHLDYRYMGRYPVVELAAERRERRSYYKENEDDDWIPFLWLERAVKLGMSIPLQYNRGPVLYSFTPSFRIGVTQASMLSESPSFLRSNNVLPMEYRLVFTRQTRSVPRDIRPRWGQQIDLQYRNAPWGSGDIGAVWAGRITGLFPGLARHHSFRLALSYQDQKEGTPKTNTINYAFPRLISYPRGIQSRYDARVLSLSADYAFPVAYPELTIPGVFYLKRLHLNVFTDYAYANPIINMGPSGMEVNWESFGSAGVDFIGQTHLLRFFSPVDIGMRSIYFPDTNRWTFRLLFGFEI